LDHELDEKVRILSDIKKLQNQILVSDKLSPFLKKFDRKRVGRSGTLANSASLLFP
jgi:hypothetical protein